MKSPTVTTANKLKKEEEYSGRGKKKTAANSDTLEEERDRVSWKLTSRGDLYCMGYWENRGEGGKKVGTRLRGKNKGKQS